MAASTVIETMSCMNGWMFAARYMVLLSSHDHHKVKAATRCQLLVAKTASTMWANLILKCRDAVLDKVKDYISEFFMGLWNFLLSGSFELFPRDTVKKIIVKAVRKAIAIEKP